MDSVSFRRHMTEGIVARFKTMPAALRWFAEHQPLTPFTETLRGLLLGTEIGSDGIVTVLWAV
jgi:ABC-2 type transport system permease protein